MKTNFTFVSICVFLSALLLSIILSDFTGSMFEKLFHPNYGWWGGPELVVVPFFYIFFLVLFFVLWNRQKYYYPVFIFLSPIIVLLLITIISHPSVDDIKNFGTLFVLPGVVAFALAKFINLIVFKFKHRNTSSAV